MTALAHKQLPDFPDAKCLNPPLKNNKISI